MAAAPSVEVAAAARARGNELFKAQKYEDAASHYTTALSAAWDGIALSSLAKDIRTEAVSALLNRAQCWIKLQRHEAAARDCTTVLEVEPGNEKALFRRATAQEALAQEALGNLRGAIEDATRLLQVNRTNTDGMELLRRLRASATGTGGVGRPGASAMPASTGSRMTVGECLTKLREYPGYAPRGSDGAEPAEPAAAHVKPPRLGQSDAADVLASLNHALQTSTGAAEFLTSDGPCLLLCRVPEASTTAAFNVLLPLYGRVVSSHAAEWGRKWAAGSAGGTNDDDTSWTGDACTQTGSHPGRYAHPSQAAVCGAIAASVTRHFVPTLAVLLDSTSGVGFSPASAHAVMNASAAGIVAGLTLARGALERQQTALLSQKEGVRKGPGHMARVRLGLPPGLAQAVTVWAQAVGALLRRQPASLPAPSGGGGAPSGRDWSLHAATLAAVAHVIRTFPLEALVEPLFATGALASVLALTTATDGAADAALLKGKVGGGSGAGASSGNVAGAVKTHPAQAGETRRMAQAVLSLSFTILRDTYPRGHADAGRTKLRRVLSALSRPLVADLAQALPQPRTDEASAASPGAGGENGSDRKAAAGGGDGAGESAPDPFYGDVPFPLPLSDSESAVLPSPDWSPASPGTAEDRARAVCLLTSSLLVDRDAGLWLGSQPGILPAVFLMSASPWPAVQASASEAVSQLTSDDIGRSLLTSLPERVVSSDPSTRARLDVMGLLRRLAESGAPAVRSSAAVTLAKLTGPSKAFTSKDGAKGAAEMIANTLALVRAAAGFDDEVVDEEGGTDDDEAEADGVVVAGGKAKKKAPAIATAAAPKERFGSLVAHFSRGFKRDLSLPGAPSHSSADSAGASGAARGVPPGLTIDLDTATKAIEALAMLAGHTRTKAAIASPGVIAALTRIAAAVVAGLEAQKQLRRAQLDAAERRREGEPASDGVKDAVLLRATGGPLTRAELRPAAYGLAFILYCVTISRTRQQELKLAGMDVDVAQWRELQKMLTPQELREAGVVAPEGGEEMDPQEAVGSRVRALLDYGEALSLLSGLAGAVQGFPEDEDAVSAEKAAAASSVSKASPAADKGAALKAAAAADASRSRNGAACRDMVAQALCNVSEWQWARGQLVAAGALPLLLDVATGDSTAASGGSEAKAPSVTLEGALAAAHAIARVLVTTNPSLIPPSQLCDVIPALLRICRESSSDLQQFEATMALTNIASLGGEVRETLVSRGGLAAIEFVQFSEHNMLRRAGTECLSNLATSDGGARMILGPSRVGLWLALARSYEAPGAATPEAPAASGGSGEGTPSQAVAPRTAAEAAAFLKKRQSSSSNKGSSGDSEGEQRDTPTALAAAGGLAMALNHHVVGLPSSSRDPRVHASAQDAAHTLVDAGGVSSLSELVMSGLQPLAHRAVACLATLALYSRGVAALLAPLGSDDDEGSGSSEDDDASSLSCATLLALLAAGKDPAALASGTGLDPNGEAPPGAGMPPAIAALAKSALARVVATLRSTDRGWAAVSKAAESDGSELPGADTTATAAPGAGHPQGRTEALAATAKRARSFAPLLQPSSELVDAWATAAGREALQEAEEDVQDVHEDL